MGGDDVSSALDRHTAAASSARELRLELMQQLGGAANDPVADLQWRLKVSEDIRRKSNDRLSELLKGEKWEEPIARPKGRAREDVLLAALEDVMRDARNQHEAEAKKSEQARQSMMDQLGRTEDETLEKDHELSKVKEDRDKHLRVILETQERLAREILLRKEEKCSMLAKSQELEGVLKQREALVDSLMKQRQELQMRLSRMGDMERELENVRSKLTAAEEGREMISKRCDGLGEKTRGLEQELEAAKEEAKRNAELARTAEDKLAAQLSSSGGGAGAGPSAPPGPSTPAAAQLPGAGAAAAAAAAAAAGNPLGAPTPPESPSQEELLEYAKFLGMEVESDRDKELLWIAKEAMGAALPAGWTQHEDKDDFVFYYNSATEQSTYEHPMDDFYRKVYQRAKTTAERDPTLLKQGTAAATGGSASALVEASSITPPGRRRSPGNVGGGQPAGILKQPRAPEAPTQGSPPMMSSQQYADKLRALEAENERLRANGGAPSPPAPAAAAAAPALPQQHSMPAAPMHGQQVAEPASPPEPEEATHESGLTEEEIAKIPNPYGLSKEALVKKFLFDRERAHQNSTARARKAGPVTIPTTPTVPIASPTPVETSNHQSTPQASPAAAGAAASTPRPSETAVQIMDQQGIMQIPQGAEIFEQRLQELSKNTDGIDTGGMDYIDSWAQQNAASTPSPAK